MSNITKVFNSLLAEGTKAMQQISEPKDKAMAAAELLKAIAATGSVYLTDDNIEASTEEVVEAVKEPKTKAKGKTTPKAKSSSKAEEKKSKVAEEKAEETVEELDQTVEEAEQEPENKEEAAATEVELTEEWTDEAMDVLSEELEFVGQMQEEYDEEQLNECISMFSEGNLKTVEDLNPLNIKGFVAFIQELLADGQAS